MVLYPDDTNKLVQYRDENVLKLKIACYETARGIVPK